LSELFDFSDRGHATRIIVTLHGETSEREPHQDLPVAVLPPTNSGLPV
jgi:hypothetical protein